MKETFSYFISPFLLLIFLASCTPSVYYFGEQYQPSTERIQIFYDEKEIDQPYKLIGKMIADELDNFPEDNSLEVKKALEEKARAVGADAILITDLEITGDSVEVWVKAEAIKFLE